MKKLIALALAMVLLLSLAACGASDEDGAQDSTTTTTTTTTTVGEDTTTTTATTTVGTDSVDTTDTTVTTTTTTTTTAYVPSGATVPIGTKPTTTTTTKKPTTTTTTQVEEPAGTSTTVTTTTTTTTTVTTTKPTEPGGPYIVLPEIGSDIDVTKKKDRIRVSAVAAWNNPNGTIGVSLTFKNYSSNWITEETDYVEYTCYDKNGNVVQKATKLMIGVIDTKKNPVKTFEFDVPADTVEVAITFSKIVYWTEWS